MVSELPTLSSLISGYPQTAPQFGAELILTEDDELADAGLSDTELELIGSIRRHLRTAAVSRGLSAQLSNAQQVEEALLAGDLAVMRKHWVTYPLDKKRRRSFQPFSATASRTVRLRTNFVPTHEELEQKHALDPDGVYLLIWGGSPAALAIPDVRQRLVKLASQVPIADVIFHQQAAAGYTAKTWSLRERIGSSENLVLVFPDEDLLKEVALWP